jgi:subtilisin-like proprotein convertase family protein
MTRMVMNPWERAMQPTDPLYSQQWHFTRLGDIERIWDEFSGAGIHVGVFDTGIEITHPSLAGAYDPTRRVIINGTPLDGLPNELAPSAHGTAVVGLIDAAANDGLGGLGVAWGSTFTSVDMLDPDSPAHLYLAPQADVYAAFHQTANFDITNHSWGFDVSTAYLPSSRLYGTGGFAGINTEYGYASASGRGGLGAIIVQGIGNDSIDAQYSGANVSRFTISVAGTQQDGFAAGFSNDGACVLVTAPATNILTTDLVGAPGYGDGDDTDAASGTSVATPQVSGTVALMLQANPDLGWRDVQNIIAASATHTGSAIGTLAFGPNEESHWLLNGAADWNGGGMHFSNDYGYGALNAYNAVRMAEVWSLFEPAQTSANEQFWYTFDDTDRAIPDNGTLQFSIPIVPSPPMDVEHVELRIDLTHSNYTQLDIFLVSPDGTETRLYDGSGGSDATADGSFNWTYGVDGLRGEAAAGSWTVRIEDTAAGETGTLFSGLLMLFGEAAAVDDVYHYTDEFLAMAALAGEGGRASLADTNGGTDWIDAASVAGDVVLSLGPGGGATVDGVSWFTIAGGTIVENAVTGDGSDDLTGNGAANRLHGMRGNDSLAGLDGDDTIDGGKGDDIARFTQDLGNYTLDDLGSRILVAGAEGSDTLFGIEHLQFADGTLDVDDGNLLFDTLYYLSRNPDVFRAGVSAREHYDTFGWGEARDPNGWFDSSGYLAVNRDVAAAGLNPLAHYHQHGWHEGRDPSASFDTALYLLRNPDVAAAGIDPLAHYLLAGRAEGREAYAAVGSIVDGFDAQYYLFSNPDVAAAGVDPLWHFNAIGWREGRDPNGHFDTAGYLAQYADVAAAGINPLWHYAQAGWKEGRDPSAGFDTRGYLADNPDVAAASVNPLDHYLIFGIYEGRGPVNDGAWW